MGLVPDPRDFHRRVEDGMRHLTGHHVDLVGFGDGDQQLGIARARFGQDIRIGCRADNPSDIHLVCQTLDLLFGRVDNGDVILFLGKMRAIPAPTSPAPQITIFMSSHPRRMRAFAGG